MGGCALTRPLPAPERDNLRGAAFMTLAMAGFAVEDLLLKFAARSLPAGEVLLIFGLLGTLGFALLAWRAGETPLPRGLLARPMLLRAGSEGLGRAGYTLALAFGTLSGTTAILQAAPLVVVAGAALIFGERVGPRRWAAVLAGFGGVMLILRPGTEALTPAAALAVLGMLGFAGRDLATRAAPPSLSNRQLGVAGFAMMLPTGAAILAWSGGAVLPGPEAALALGAATGTGMLAYTALTRAMRTGDVSAVTPLRYTRLIFGVGLGVLVLGERPDAATILGAAIIAAAGVFALLRGRRMAA